MAIKSYKISKKYRKSRKSRKIRKKNKTRRRHSKRRYTKRRYSRTGRRKMKGGGYWPFTSKDSKKKAERTKEYNKRKTREVKKEKEAVFVSSTFGKKTRYHMVKRCKHKVKNSDKSPTIANLGARATRTYKRSGKISQVCRCVNTKDNPDDNYWCCVKWDKYKGYKKIQKEEGTFQFPNKECQSSHAIGRYSRSGSYGRRRR